jgi:hypothetical protein
MPRSHGRAGGSAAQPFLLGEQHARPADPICQSNHWRKKLFWHDPPVGQGESIGAGFGRWPHESS